MSAESAHNVFILGAGSADFYPLEDDNGKPYQAPGHLAGAKTSISAEAQQYYESLPDNAFALKAGGNGANIGRRAAVENYDVHFLSAHGDDANSQIIAEDLESYPTITNHSVYSPEHRSSRAYIECFGGDRHIRNVGRASLGLTISRQHVRELMLPADIAIATSVKSPALHEIFFKEALAADVVRENNFRLEQRRQIFVSALPGSTDFEKHQDSLITSFLQRRPNALFSNAEEAHELAKAYSNAAENQISKDPEYLMGVIGNLAEHVVITDGSKGIYLSVPSRRGRNEKTVVYEPAVPVDRIVDTTGAGDSVAWAMTRELYKTRGEKYPDYYKVLKAGTHAGAAAIQHLGAIGDIEHLKA